MAAGGRNLTLIDNGSLAHYIDIWQWLRPEADEGQSVALERFDLFGVKCRGRCTRIYLGLNGEKAHLRQCQPLAPADGE